MHLANPGLPWSVSPVSTVFVSGLNELLAQHVAHLFIRDPIVLFAERVEQDEENESDHFEVSRVQSLHS